MSRGVFRARRALSIAVACAAVFSCLSIATARRAVACPASPPTLGEHIRDADAIVVGRITSLEQVQVTIEGEEQTIWVARFDAEEVLSGQVDPFRPLELTGYQLERERETGPDTRTLLVFTVGLDEGAAHYTRAVYDVTDFGARADLTSRVREMVEIGRVADERERWRRHAEWAVRCVESPHTRYEGAQEVERYGTRYTDEGEEVDMLDASQRERLLRVLVELESPDDPGALELASVLSELDDSRVTSQLEHWLASTAEAPPDRTPWIMHIIAARLEWRTGSWLASRYPDDAKRRARRAAVLRFLDLMRAGQELPEALAEAASNAAEEASEIESEVESQRRNAIEKAESEFEFEPEEPPEPIEVLDLNVDVNDEGPSDE